MAISSLALLGCAAPPAASQPKGETKYPAEGAAKGPPIEIQLAAMPASTLRDDQLDTFQLEFVVRNLGSATIDPMLGTSVLRVDGAPVKDWDITINNGPRDKRWTALPPSDSLRFGYAMRGSLFHGPGRYSVVLEAAGATSSPLLIQVLPR
jgi:hypothetical protein